MLISVGWLPPYLCPSRRLLRSRDEGRGLITLSKVAPLPGPRLVPMARDHNAIRPWTRVGSPPAASGGERDQAGDGPGEGRHFPCDGHDDLIGVLAARGQLAVALAQAHLGLPVDRLHPARQLLYPEPELAAHLGCPATRR